MMTLAQLIKLTGPAFADRKAAFTKVISSRGGPLKEPPVYAQAIAQILQESGSFRYVKELWGPTAAQLGYQNHRYLGNTLPGDGIRFMGRDLIQITGRANYQALSLWAGHDFVENPEDLTKPRWVGTGVVWYFLEARPRLIQYCRAGNNEMVTRTVNGGLNDYDKRLVFYDKAALVMLGVPSIVEFQSRHKLRTDGISGPLTRAALHGALGELK